MFSASSVLSHYSDLWQNYPADSRDPQLLLRSRRLSMCSHYKYLVWSFATSEDKWRQKPSSASTTSRGPSRHRDNIWTHHKQAILLECVCLFHRARIFPFILLKCLSGTLLVVWHSGACLCPQFAVAGREPGLQLSVHLGWLRPNMSRWQTDSWRTDRLVCYPGEPSHQGLTEVLRFTGKPISDC